MFKRLTLILLSSLLFLNSMFVPLKALAQEDAPSTWYNQSFTGWYSKVYGEDSPPSEIFGERYTAAQVQWIVYSIFSLPINFLGSKVQGAVSCALAGASGGLNVVADVSCAKKSLDILLDIFKVLNISTSLGYVSSPANVSLANSIIFDYQNRPLSGIKYVSNSISKFLSVPQANAQGFGFSAVDGLQKYWQGFRDVAYALSVIIVVIFAFMIMFRVKLSPQLVISVQSSLPKVFGALILATFSYAIAGFVIDLSYVVGGLFASLMNLAGFSTSFSDAFNQITPISQSSTQIGHFYVLYYMCGYAIVFLLAALWSIIGTFASLSVFGVLGSLLSVLAIIWVVCVVLWYTLKVPVVLIKNLISLFLSIVVAPIQIVLGSLVPSIGFSVWLKKIIAEALVFPVTGLFMFLAMKMLDMSLAATTALVTSSNAINLWAPPILGTSSDLSALIWLAMSFIIITMIPKTVDIMKMLIMGAKFDFGTAMGEATSPLVVGGNILSSTQAKEYARKGTTAGSVDDLVNGIMNAVGTLSGGKIKRG